jgi:hypothetical protein
VPLATFDGLGPTVVLGVRDGASADALRQAQGASHPELLTASHVGTQLKDIAS